jgi:hypothetical protein
MDGTVTLRNLKVISALAQNDKINTKDDYFSIYNPTTWRGLARLMYYGEGREHNIQKLSQCIKDAIAFITTCMNELVTERQDESSDTTFMRTFSLNSKSQTCHRMMISLEDSVKGIESLKITYKDDASSTSKLDCLIYEIQDFLDTTRSFANTSPTLTRLK